MLHLEQGIELPPEQKIALAIDTPVIGDAERYMTVAKNCGAVMVKLGYEIRRTLKEEGCSQLAADYGLEWIADFKFYAINKSIHDPITELVELNHPPIGITVATHSGVTALKHAQSIANQKGIVIFGAAHLSAISEEETLEYSGRTSSHIMRAEATRLYNARAKGLVTAGKELAYIKSKKYLRGLVTLVVGTRSEGVFIADDDQQRIITPTEAVRLGGDIIEIGRQVTQAEDMDRAYKLAADDIRLGQTYE